jgi:hypothetical protein
MIIPSRVLHDTGTEPKKQILGVYSGSVANTNDPKRSGRVKLTIPQVLGTAVSNWAVPFGFTSDIIPPVSTLVHVMFDGGDINHPIYFTNSGFDTHAIEDESGTHAIEDEGV